MYRKCDLNYFTLQELYPFFYPHGLLYCIPYPEDKFGTDYIIYIVGH